MPTHLGQSQITPSHFNILHLYTPADSPNSAAYSRHPDALPEGLPAKYLGFALGGVRHARSLHSGIEYCQIIQTRCGSSKFCPIAHN